VRGRDRGCIRLGERVRLVGQKDDVRLQRENVLELESWIARTIAQQVAPADALDEIRNVGVAAAPHPGLFPDGDNEREGGQRLALGGKLFDQFSRALFGSVSFAQHCDQLPDVIDRFRLGGHDPGELRDLVCVLLQVLFDVHVDDIGA